MNFNSPEYLFFVPLVLVVVALLFRREALRDLALLAFSYAFYMSWNWKYAGLIALSTLVDYAVGARLEREQRQRARKALLVTSLAMNLGLLGLFKYYNFFVDVARDGLSLFGHDLGWTHHHLLLPVGISFYTFQTLSYTIDVYRREIPAERDLVKFSLFVSFFPQLVAGPIVRAADFLPQLRTTPQVSEERIRAGLWRIFRGLAKKVLLADLLANYAVDAAFKDPAGHSSWDLLMALYAYAYQIYNDFSGYSDIAIGTAALLGYHIPENFDRPYLAQNVREFWTRWHISLSTWLRDYLYIPLGGNRGTRGRVAFNLMATMLLGGLWHGAAITFVLWGAYHGLLLVLARGRERVEHGVPAARRWLRRALCFHLVVLGWLLFRATDLANLAVYVEGLARFTGGTELHPYFYVVLAAAALAHLGPRALVDALGARVQRLPRPAQGALYAGAILLLCGATISAPAFIYFQF